MLPNGKRLERNKIEDIYIYMVSVVCNIGLYENIIIKKNCCLSCAVKRIFMHSNINLEVLYYLSVIYF